MLSFLPCDERLCFVASFENFTKHKQVTRLGQQITKEQYKMARGKRKAEGKY
jgi:hypothetical protein